MLQNVWRDARYGFRGLVTRPGFTLIAMLTLALGIGSAAAIFSVIQNVLLDPAPYADVERIAYVQIRDASRSEPGGRTAFQLPEFLDYREQSQVFEDVIGGSFDTTFGEIDTGEGNGQLRVGIDVSTLAGRIIRVSNGWIPERVGDPVRLPGAIVEEPG